MLIILKKHSTGALNFMEKESLIAKVENANFQKVQYYIEKVLSESQDYCACHRCRLDVLALALNTLPPHYYVSPTHAPDRDMGSPWILIEMAVKEAFRRVGLTPHHHHPSQEQKDAAVCGI